jgi:uncharacterized protein (TIGR03435 family)
MRAFALLVFIGLFSNTAFGQLALTVSTPTFEAADIHPSPHTTNPNPFMTGGVLRGGRYDLRKATMVDLIRVAYDVDPDTILGGPNWLETDRFDIIAKAPPETSAETIKLMLKALLADRFKLVLHKDMKPMPAFVLTMGKGKPKLKEADGSGNTGCQPQQQKPEPGTIPYAMVSCHNMSMREFARMLRLMAGAYMTNPVIDSTDLKGNWDFDLKWTGRAQLGQAASDGISIYDAVDKQLGLRLEAQRVPSPVLIVDNVNQKPTDNPPAVTQALPPTPPAEFEVAVVKPSAPDSQLMFRMLPGGQMDMQGVPLKMLIAFAWNFDFATTNDMIVGAPKFLDSARFDIKAKASVGTSTGPSVAPQIDIDDLRLMLRALLADRFKLATHNEDRPVTAYNLVAVKPRLKPADPTNRTGFREGPGADGKDPRNTNPTLSRLVTCQNMTMAQFADLLQKIAPGYIHSPVLDATGLEGAWDFTLSFSGSNLLQAAAPNRGGDAGPQPQGGAPTASDPNGAVSLFDAVSKQLGLKLEEKKRPVSVLVIDHVEEKPTDN